MKDIESHSGIGLYEKLYNLQFGQSDNSSYFDDVYVKEERCKVV